MTIQAAKLQINGLVQVWFQSIQNDSRGIVKPAGGPSQLAGVGRDSDKKPFP
ncbi:MAG: hypothetical protein WCT04_17090 [Planctomycetota bacterium]